MTSIITILVILNLLGIIYIPWVMFITVPLLWIGFCVTLKFVLLILGGLR